MHLLHIALPGCLRAAKVQYGLTADTGGHIRYLLELADALAASGRVGHIQIATRAFSDPALDPCYARREEYRSDRVSILRIPTASPHYLAKEELGSELESFAAGLIGYLKRQPMLPRLVHAHFSEAAFVAGRIEGALGIPFVFTPHSLGAIKAAAMAASPSGNLALRIDLEDRALRRARAVIGSSVDERDVQWAHYPGYEDARKADRIRVLPPGCNIREFGQPIAIARRARVAGMVDRFLEDPGKPLVLGLARPVRKKNLLGLVDAFGAERALRESANLAIFAGSRDRIEDGEPEATAMWRSLFERIDRHDLWGTVAIPKAHEPEDVSAIYALAAQRGGLFANLAFNEPFGLTLLEAAASGLPVVATDSGGPVDIVATLENGTLVPATDPGAAAAAMLDLLSDRRRWREAAGRGAERVRRFSWSAHVEDYLALIEEVAPVRTPACPTIHRRRAPRSLVITDIDDTLTGNAAGLSAFTEWRREHPEVAFAVATGRHLGPARRVLADWGAPEPDLFVTAVGTEIDRPTGRGFGADPTWHRLISTGWQGSRIARLVAGFPLVVPQPEENQSAFKLSYFAPDDPALIDRLKAALAAAGCSATVIHSHGCYLDILPARASKGTAALYAAQALGIPSDRIIAAGDSGNDRALLEAARYPVLVANHRPELSSFSDITEARLWRSRRKAAAGVLEGVEAALAAIRRSGAA